MSDQGFHQDRVGIEINLLPWREQARERRTRQLYLWMALCALAGLSIGLAGQQWQQWRLDRVSADIELVESRIAVLEEEIDAVQTLDQSRRQMQERIRLISELQFSRPQTVALFQALNDTMIEGVVYERIERREGRLDISGLARTNRQVSDQMRALASAEVLGEPLLENVQAEEGQQRRRFNLQVPELPLAQRRQPGIVADSAGSEDNGDTGERR